MDLLKGLKFFGVLMTSEGYDLLNSVEHVPVPFNVLVAFFLARYAVLKTRPQIKYSTFCFFVH